MPPLSLFTLLVGLIAAIHGIVSAILQQNPYWYSSFTIGSYLFFATLNRAFSGTSSLPGPGGGHFRGFLRTYGAFFVVGFLIDIVYGRFIGKNWVYPHFGLFDEFVHVLVIGYPFAFFSVLETFYLFWHCLSAIIGEPSSQAASVHRGVFQATLLIGLAGLIVPLTIPLWSNSGVVNQVVFVCMVLTTFLLDALNALRGRFSLLLEILKGNLAVLLALLFATALAALAHEVPNTYGKEWVYRNVPFTDYQVWGVNVLILTFGWLFLLVWPISLYALVGNANRPARG